MQPKPLLITLVLSVQATITTVPAYAQVSYDDPVISTDITLPTTTTPTTFPDVPIPTGDVTIAKDNPLDTSTYTEVPTAQLPSGLLGTVFNVLGPKQKPGQARVINETQRKILKVYEYGQKALDAYKVGRAIYDAIDNFSLKRILSGSISTVLSEYDKLGTNGTSESQQGGSGSEDPIYSDPQDPFQVYTQARNNEARKALLPQLMTQLVFSEDGQALIQQQGEQVQQSVVNTIESTQALVQLSAASKEQATAGAGIATSVGETGQKAQTLKSSQAVLKSLTAQNSLMAQGTATNGAILSNVVSGQEEQKKSSDALVVGSALAHQQRTTGLHLSASELTLQEQIRAELELYKDERHRAQDQAALREQLSFNYLYIPGLYSEAAP
ncbi:hypothetical protein [Acaryochloris marina]|uniref:Uncharacterized protein n=1 Tax=Acaryochloris marina (strain MBIC 11017) TaxID=329726 RepID=A8ZK37_ACAM1|nr:hypothetical protein [Acaryochloris marina]ABW31537.1 hypothetical protein AM1_A0028 [Acaryochloris marina MBIC11017]